MKIEWALAANNFLAEAILVAASSFLLYNSSSIKSSASCLE
jgi:hypothetical protein